VPIRAFLLAALIALSPTAFAQTPPAVTSAGDVKTLLYIGNSFFYFNDSMHSIVLRLVAAGDPENRAKYRATSVTISGSGLNWHDLEAYLKPGGGMASYTFAPGNKVVFNKFDKPFDAVLMNDCSQCPVHPQLKDLFHEEAKKKSEIARKYGATPMLFMTWAYQDAPEMTSQLAEAYTRAGNANNALVVPAGLAFAKAVQRDPSVNLYNADKRHPSAAGSYLAACVIYAAVHGRNPVGNSHKGGLEPKTADFLQQVAADTVREYLGKNF
jgi:hypothetical protein